MFYVLVRRRTRPLSLLRMTVVLAIVPQDTQSEGAIVPSCPITGCSVVLSQDEITRIIDRGYHEKLHESKDFTKLLQGKALEIRATQGCSHITNFPKGHD